MAAWNELETFWDGEPDPPPGTPPAEEVRPWEAWDLELEVSYWNPAVMDGAIPICHLGCALRQWLVIHGERRGFVWNDFRADYRGLSHVLDESAEAVTYTVWYMGWLDEPGTKAAETSCSTVVPSWLRAWRRFSGWGGSGQPGPERPGS